MHYETLYCTQATNAEDRSNFGSCGQWWDNRRHQPQSWCTKDPKASSANQDNPSVTWWQKCGPSYEVETETSQLDQVNQGNYLLSQD